DVDVGTRHPPAARAVKPASGNFNPPSPDTSPTRTFATSSPMPVRRSISAAGSPSIRTTAAPTFPQPSRPTRQTSLIPPRMVRRRTYSPHQVQGPRWRWHSVKVEERTVSDQTAGGMHTLSLRGDFFSRFVHASSDAIAISRLSDGRLIDVNQPFLDLMGFSRDDVIGKTTLEIGLWAAPEDRAQMLRALEHGGSASGVEFELHTSTGDVRYMEASVQVLEIDGEPCILAIDRGVTERKRAEALRRAAEELLLATIESPAE